MKYTGRIIGVLSPFIFNIIFIYNTDDLHFSTGSILLLFILNGIVGYFFGLQFDKYRYSKVELRNSKLSLKEYSYALKSTKDGVAILNDKGEFQFVNQSLLDNLRYDNDELFGKPWCVAFREKDYPWISENILAAMNTTGYWQGELIGVRKDGTTFPQEVTLSKIRETNRFVSIHRDITEKRNIENELKRSEEKFRSMVQYSSDIISIVDQHGVIQYQSPSSERILGYKPEELIGLKGFNNNHPNEREKAEKVFNKVLNHPGTPIRTELRLRNKNGSWLYCEQISTNLLDTPNVQGIVVNIRDITTQREYLKQLEYLAYHDELTKLLNKRGLNELLINEVKESQVKNSIFSILFLDLDNFKFVNDNLGHEVGDKLLKRISAMLREVIGERGNVSRLGGDEFVILVRDITSVNQASSITKEILEMFNQPFIIDQYQFYITSSVGIAIYPDGSNDITSLLKNADMAMYKAKLSGKNTYRIFDKDMNKVNVRTFTIQNDLRTAITKNEFILYYQPRIRTEDQKMIGVEALIRWKHPTLGIISPAEFISIAEDSGLIGTLGDWVLETACKQMAAWSKLGYKHLLVSVNFSPLQFLQINLQEKVKNILNKYEVDPQRLEIEITESAVIDQDVGLKDNITKLKEKGLQIAIDDFGTGYSSLAYLNKFRVNTIKIDRSFLMNFSESKSNKEIVSAIITLAHALGINVVAEGVETVEQFNMLKEMDCDEVQGYFFSKPIPNDEIEKHFLING